MERNIIIEQLKSYNYVDGDEVLIEVNEKNINLLIESINDLQNHDFTSFPNRLILEIIPYNNTEIDILKDITGKIPSNIVEISLSGFNFLNFKIDDLHYDGNLIIKNSIFGKFRIKNSNISSINLNNISQFGVGEKLSIGIRDNTISQISLYNSIGVDEFIINDNTIDNFTIQSSEITYFNNSNNNLNTTTFKRNSINRFEFKGKNINKLIIEGEENNDEVYKINELIVSKTTGREISINNLKIHKISLNNVYVNKINLKELSGIDEKLETNIKVKYDNIDNEDLTNLYINTEIFLYKLKSIYKIKIQSSDEKFNNKSMLSIHYKNCKFLEDGYYYLGGLGLNILSFSDSTNLSKIFKLINLKIDTFKIDDYDFGKTILNNVSINYKLLIDSPIFKDATFNNVSFTNIGYKIGLLCPENSRYTKNDYKNLKDYYRQLKYVMDQNGNYTEGNHFFDKEMEAHGKSLDSNFDRFIYWTQKIISNFGNSWIKPLIGLLILGYLKTIIFDYKLYKNFEYLDLNKNYFNFNDFYIILTDISKNINPLQDLSSNEITFSLFLYKIIIGILIYHLFMSLKRMTKR